MKNGISTESDLHIDSKSLRIFAELDPSLKKLGVSKILIQNHKIYAVENQANFENRQVNQFGMKIVGTE